jgi:hypothetical protein
MQHGGIKMRNCVRNAMFLLVLVLTVFAGRVLVRWGESRAAEPEASMRAVFVEVERVAPELLATWKAKPANAVVVPPDDASKRQWKPMAEADKRGIM